LESCLLLVVRHRLDLLFQLLAALALQVQLVALEALELAEILIMPGARGARGMAAQPMAEVVALRVFLVMAVTALPPVP
jgi:hypothetical protein